MFRSPTLRAGFTLVELMLGVAIVGVLASIAIPNYTEMQFKAKRTEAWNNLAGIGIAERAYEATYDEFIAGDSNPGTSLNKKLRNWDTTISGWKELGWVPDGQVRCNYIANIFDDGIWARIDVYCDIDADNNSAIIRYYLPEDEASYYVDVYTDRF